MGEERVLLDVPHDPGIAGALVCHGPAVEGPCPLLCGGTCAKFEAASQIVFRLDLDDAANRAILARYRQLAPEVPVIVVTSREQAARWSADLGGCSVHTREPVPPIRLDRGNLPDGGS